MHNHGLQGGIQEEYFRNYAHFNLIIFIPPLTGFYNIQPNRIHVRIINTQTFTGSEYAKPFADRVCALRRQVFSFNE